MSLQENKPTCHEGYDKLGLLDSRLKSFLKRSLEEHDDDDVMWTFVTTLVSGREFRPIRWRT